MLIDGMLSWWDYELYLSSFSNHLHNNCHVPLSTISGLRVGIDIVVFMRNSMEAVEIFQPISGPDQFAGVLRSAQQLIDNDIFPIFVFPGMEIVASMQRCVIPAKETSLHVFCDIKNRNDETAKNNYKFVRKRITVENLKNLYLYLNNKLVDQNGNRTGLCIQGPGNLSSQLSYMQQTGVIDCIIGGIAPIFFGVERVFNIHVDNQKSSAQIRLMVIRSRKLKEHLQISHDNHLFDILIAITFVGRLMDRSYKKNVPAMASFSMAIDLAKSTSVPELVRRLYQDKLTRQYMSNAVTLMYQLHFPMVVSTEGKIIHIDLMGGCDEVTVPEIRNKVIKDRMHPASIPIDKLYYGAGTLPTILFKLVSKGILDHQFLSAILTTKWIMEYTLPFYACESTISLHMELSDMRLQTLGLILGHMNEYYWNLDYTILAATREYTHPTAPPAEGTAWIESMLRQPLKAKPIFVPIVEWCIQGYAYNQGVAMGLLPTNSMGVSSILEFHHHNIHDEYHSIVSMTFSPPTVMQGDVNEKKLFYMTSVLMLLSHLQYFTFDGHPTALSNYLRIVPDEFSSFLLVLIELLKGGFIVGEHIDYSQEDPELSSILEKRPHPLVTRILSTFSTPASSRRHDITKYYNIDLMIHQTLVAQMKSSLSMLAQACVANLVLGRPSLYEFVDHDTILGYDGGVFEGFHQYKDTFKILLFNHLLQSQLDGISIEEHLRRHYPTWTTAQSDIALYLHYWVLAYTAVYTLVVNPEKMGPHPLFAPLKEGHQYMVSRIAELDIINLPSVSQLPTDIIRALSDNEFEGLSRHLSMIMGGGPVSVVGGGLGIVE